MKSVILALGVLTLTQTKRTDDEKRRTVIDFSDVSVSGALVAPDGAFLRVTAGGAQDGAFFRERALARVVPRPGAITAEGLLSEHHLPLGPTPKCPVLLCPVLRAAPVRLVSRPEVSHLVQVGFTSGISMASFQRAPLNLVAVVDRSGSMAGQKLALVKETLLEIRRKLRPADRLALVTFDDRAVVALSPSPPSAGRVEGVIRRLRTGGGTNLEAGLELGFRIARRSRRFDGTTRVMLFTDERPNIGRTDAGRFRRMAEEAAALGIGLTTIGVGVDFGAELAATVSAIAGGNLFYFPDPARMAEVVEEDFAMMVTELGRDLDLRITPGDGLRVAGLYGIPASAVKRSGRSISVTVATLFASKRRGAIYVALAPEGEAEGPLAVLDLAFTEAGGRRRHAQRAAQPAAPTLGLTRGAHLIDAYVAAQTAAERFHHLNDPAGGAAVLEPVVVRYRALEDEDLRRELPMLEALLSTLTQLAGSHPGEISLSAHQRRTGP